MPEKVSLFKELYDDIAECGMGGDTELAHVNDFEVSVLKSLGGSGTVNQLTGLMEFKGGGGSPPPPPASQTVTQTSEFPTELRPFIEDVLGEGRAEFGREKGEGFQPFPGPQIAAFTPEQQQAFASGRQQFTGLAGTPLGQAATYYAPALSSTAIGTSEIGTEDIGRRMDPFLQNVVDIAKREAIRDEEAAVQARAAQAVGAGSFGGTRQGLVEAEGERNLAERLADIQAQGLSSAFQNAQIAAEQQRARELTGGRQFAALGDITGQRARSDIAGLAGIGETQQQRRQQALDIAQREFEQERAFPSAALQRYSSLIRGFPLQETQQRFSTQTTPTPSLAQTLVGGLGTAAGLYGAFGGFNAKGGGLVSLQAGGLPGAQFNPSTAGGFNTTPMPPANQYPNPENVINALDHLRQRGASIRGLSLPQVPQKTLPAEISSQALSGVLPAAKGGLMSVVRRGLGGLPTRIEQGIDTPDPTTGSFEGDYERARRSTLTGTVPFAHPKRTALSEAQTAYSEGVKGRAGVLAERQKALADRQRQAQFGNLAQFFSRLGTDVSPGAQVGGLSGLLGAGVSAGAQTLPEVLQTKEDFYQRELDLADQIEQAELAGLETDVGIAEASLTEEKELRGQRAALDQELFKLGTDLQTVTADIRIAEANALEYASSSDVNSMMGIIAEMYKVDYIRGPNNEIIISDEANAEARAAMNMSVLKALKAIAGSQGDAPGINIGINAIQGDVEKFFGGESDVGGGGRVPDVDAIALLKQNPDTLNDFMEVYGLSEEEAKEYLDL